MLKTLDYTSGKPEIVNADFVPADLVDSKVQVLVTRKMVSWMDLHAMRAVCDLRGQVVARFKPSLHPHFSGDDDFGPEAA